MTTHPSQCGCCAGVRDQTPIQVENRPGLAEIAYRAASYTELRASMIAGLTTPDRAALTRLRTRDPRDFSLALIDAWAVVGDVLTFYTERIANEHYLGTATERRSVSGLAGLIGYRLDAGVAARTTLAFALDEAPRSPTAVPIAAGAKAQTLPGPDQLPQTFETVEDLQALVAWNAPPVKRTEARQPQEMDEAILLQGVATDLRRGDTLLFHSEGATTPSGFVLVRVTSVAPDPEQDHTRVAFTPPLTELGASGAVGVHVLRQRAALFGYNAPSRSLFEPSTPSEEDEPAAGATDDWTFPVLEADAIDLDAIYGGITPGSPVVFTNGTDLALTSIIEVSDVSRTAYRLSAKVTRLNVQLDKEHLTPFGGGGTRSTILLLGGEELAPAAVPVTAPVFGDRIELAQPLDPIEEPRRILIRGRRARLRLAAGATTDDRTTWMLEPGTDPIVVAIDPETTEPPTWRIRVRREDGSEDIITGQPTTFVFAPAREDDPLVGETTLVNEVDGDAFLLDEPLVHAYDRHTVAKAGVGVWGNIAEATHGESVTDEVLGSGDAAQPFQHLTLRQGPLTMVQAATPTGSESTLRVWATGVEWREVPTLFGHGPRDRVFVTSVAEDGKTVVQFGDGRSGARPPTGRDDIRASYRVGTGTAGLAAAEQLSLLMTRPLGVKNVRNPLPAEGAQDPQVAADAVDDAPRTVLTLDRIVSLRDYEDFAANVAGIGKATATWTWDGVERGVVVTIAGIDGAVIEAGSPLLTNLTSALRAAGNRRIPLVVRPARIGRFVLQAALAIVADRVVESLIAAARTQLLARYSFGQRTFGQIVSLGEVVEALHAVEGIVGVRVGRLHRAGEAAVRQPFILARAPVPGQPPPSEGAELLLIDPDGVDLEVAR